MKKSTAPGAIGSRLSNTGRARVAEAAATTPTPPDLLQHAARLAASQISLIADRTSARIRTEVAHYSSSIGNPRDLESTIYAAIELAVRSLADTDHYTESARHSWEMGRMRARDGIPLLAMTQGYRIGAAVLWDRLVELTTADRPDLATPFARCANEYWQFCERDNRLMVESYRLATSGYATHSERKLLPLLRNLLRGHADTVDATSVAVALDVPHDGRYAVVRIPSGTGPIDDDGPVRDEIGAMTLFRCPQRHGMTLVVHLGDRSPDDLRIALTERYPDVPLGISAVVVGLSAIGRANQHADLAQRIGGDDAVLLSERVPEALLVARPDLAAVHVTSVLGPVLALDPAERDILLHTVQTWLNVDGSTAQAAKALFCHNNTVLNRLRRLERLTDRELDRPRDLVELTLALDAYRLTGPTAH
ncbi:helix-turn-helix domain-containing protein [Gordonia sp. CPCC 205515]|uniref:helix-turn-helix domain-containing protein n=1 Tax=Gordonia sp. CPCC 205515 TaxID=3140791 RepID=UPI003AF3396D